MATIELKALDAQPNPCPLGAPLDLSITFCSSEALVGARWKVEYMVDMTGRRHVVELGIVGPVDYAAGENSLHFHCDAINLEGVKKSWLCNVGLLLAKLQDAEGVEVVQISCVTQVTKQADGQLVRTVLSPIE